MDCSQYFNQNKRGHFRGKWKKGKRATAFERYANIPTSDRVLDRELQEIIRKKKNGEYK